MAFHATADPEPRSVIHWRQVMSLLARIPPQTAEEPLGAALMDLLCHPLANLVETWNWKAAALSAMIRAAIFLVANLRAGGHRAFRAMVVEGVFAILASGVMGAITQRLRCARPIVATGVVVWLAMPAAMVAVEAAVHHIFATPHLRVGLTLSFLLASVASGFGWFAQRRGVLLAGSAQDSVVHDLRALPGVVLDFFATPLRALTRR
jgi:hypothetical protein